MPLTFGSDPEFFASYEESGKEYCVPPIYFMRNGLNPVDISNPKHPIFVNTKNGLKIHMDGVAFEFTIPPVKKVSELKELIEQGLYELSILVGNFGYKVSTKPTINFDVKKFFKQQDMLFQQCVIFGCDPDEDAFDYINYKSMELNVEDHPYRYGGGHLHLSGDDIIKEYPIPAVRMLAMTVGNLCVSQSLFPELDKLRSFHYGKPGKYRIQKYPDGTTGIEYRTPSNSWLTLEEEKMNNVFNLAEKAIRILHDVPLARKYLKEYTQPTIKAITTTDKELAERILGEINE
jgi:hypothetical protein